ncbi:hypothetical protein BDV35DRAFT_119888 [Aspergillus flavus]|uniref:Uncharacterized protein n=1 Tax=Aspergillus flavus TaxID=5059 RepID=A0A5N6GEV0_ASPFL|nr:hypothetical protein BDV35DRAFT_119888 [Aspergillus flavus]
MFSIPGSWWSLHRTSRWCPESGAVTLLDGRSKALHRPRPSPPASIALTHCGSVDRHNAGISERAISRDSCEVRVGWMLDCRIELQ